MQTLKLTKKYEAYPEYKDSGVEWLGMIPKNWNVYRSKNLFKKMDRAPKDGDDIVTAFRDGTVTLRKNRREDGFTMADKEIGYQRIEKGDLVIHGMDAFAGAIGVSDSDGKSSPVYSACVPIRGSNPKYHAYLLRHMSKSEYIFALAKGIRERSTEFRFKEFANLEVAEPTPTEQSKIVSHLDGKILLIDQIIEKKERLIELLKEKRIASIDNAVNKGLSTGREFVDSNIPSIGVIPKHWQIKKLKYLANIIPSNIDKLTVENEEIVRLCNYVDVYKNEKITADITENFMIASATQKQIEKFTLLNNDVIITKDSETPDDIGIPTFVPETLEGIVCGYHLAILRSFGINGEYLFRCLQSNSTKVQFFMSANGLTRYAIGIGDIGNLSVAIPPKNEQVEIQKKLDEQMHINDKAVRCIKISIEKLKEFKTSLISNVITGKIKI